MSLVQLLCGPLSPRDACWVDLIPDQANLQATQGKTWTVLFIGLSLIVYIVGARYALILEGVEFTVMFTTVVLILLCAAMLSLIITTDLAIGRHLVYFVHLIIAFETFVNAFFVPVGMNTFFVAPRRLLSVFALAATQAFWFRRVVFRPLLSTGPRWVLV